MQYSRTLATFMVMSSICWVTASVWAADGVSPGAVDRMATVETRCPTFSWGMDSDAVAHDLVAYVLPEDAAKQAELTADTEVMYARVAGSATSWTPSSEQCFAPGGRYVWFVRAVTELAHDEVVAAGEWSAGRYFTVPAAPSGEEVARAIEVIQRWEAARGDGEESPSLAGMRSGGASPTLRRSGWGGALSDAGSASPKSVPTASAAIRGEHPDTSGEKYGVVGMSSSYDGAGVAAANLDGGPDLVLDGSASAEPDARLYEWGLERESATDGHFQFINPGAGALNLEVDGTVAATGLDCPDCVTSATIDDLSVGAADLATGAVTTTKIAAGAVGASALHTNAVTTVALADGAVTGAKVADGAVGASALHTSAVTTAALADGAVTGVKIADGAVGASTIRSNAVTSIHLTDDAVSGAEIADGAVQTADLAGSAVTSAKIADGTITEADISPTSAIYVSKSQLYERDEQGTLDIVGGLYVEVCCDDANDLPMIASCDVSGPNLQLYGEESLDWSSTTDPAGWNCRFYNTTGGSFTGYAKILCISVP